MNRNIKANRAFLKPFLSLVSVVLCFLLFIPIGFAAQPDVSAKSAVLLESSTNRVLYIDNGHDLLPMASTTKVMTAILAIERGNLEDNVVVSKNASGIQGSSIWLSAGEKMKLKDMLYGLMLASGNDAAIAIAEHIGGSVDGFIQMMNLKAKEIGANNTNFANPNGLPNESHYTTAYDLALITSYAMKNPVFCQIVCTKYKNLPWEGHEYERVVKNKNKILWQYEGGNGVKTGFTKEAGKCLVASAQRNGMQLIAVVLNDGNMFQDSMKLLDYGFENYKIYTILKKDELAGKVEVIDGKETSLDIYSESDVSMPLTNKEKEKTEKKIYLVKSVKAPVKNGQTVGRVEVWLDGKKVNEVALKTNRAVEKNTYAYNFFKILDEWLNVN